TRRRSEKSETRTLAPHRRTELGGGRRPRLEPGHSRAHAAWPRRRSSRELLRPDGTRVERNPEQDRRHENERHRRGGRVVDQLEELRLDDVADHVLLRRAEQLRIDEVTCGGNEGE